MTIPLPPGRSDEFTRFADALTGQYELEREIGRGGMGVVYSARDLRLERRVAIKTLPPHLAADPVFRERFLREARMAGALSHPHIVPIHRADELGGHVFFVMGFVDGESMAERVAATGRLDAREVLRELSDVADALAYAHAHGVVHRDVKAENILIEKGTGRAMVTDFGIARLSEASPLTSTGQVLGTVYYLSPEQVSGEAVDARSDIYSLGVVGFMALAGRFPFNAELASAVLIAHVTKAPPALSSLAPDVPPSLADVIDRCLAKSPEDRFQSCGEMLDALTAISSEVTAHAERQAAIASAPKGDRLVSDTEAQAIWQRAADLQAATGLTPRPALVTTPRDRSRDAAPTSGFDLASVRDAALEAGIPAKYVEEALIERGLSGVPSERITVVDHSPKPNWFLGARTRADYEVVVDGEMPADDFELLIDIIGRKTGESGVVGGVGRSFNWHLQGRRTSLQVAVSPRNGKTTIRVSENMGGLARPLFGGIMGGYGGGSSGIWMGIGASAHNPMLGMGLWAGNVVLAYGVARTVYTVKSRTRGTLLRELAEAVAQQVLASVKAAKPARASLPRKR